jgi:hypothetical protein
MLAAGIVRSAGDRAHDASGSPLGEWIDAQGRGGALAHSVGEWNGAECVR